MRSENEVLDLEVLADDVAEHERHREKLFKNQDVELDMHAVQNNEAKDMLRKMTSMKDLLLRDNHRKMSETAETVRNNVELRHLSETLTRERDQFAQAFESGRQDLLNLRV